MKKVMKFEAIDCEACRKVSRFLDRMGIGHERINPFDRPDLATGFGIKSVPTVIVVEGDTVLLRTVGFTPDGLESIALLIEADRERQLSGKAAALSTTETYFTNSQLGGVFTLKYLGLEDNKHVFVSTAFLNKGHVYRVAEKDLRSFLYQG